tara:strand:+ start:1486 stop:1695 length:210 start_codon:yes stop_codon:yes gene_type:complete
VYKFRINEVANDSYSFAVFDFMEDLVSLTIGKEQTVRRTAEDLGFDITIVDKKLKELKEWRLKNISRKC